MLLYLLIITIRHNGDDTMMSQMTRIPHDCMKQNEDHKRTLRKENNDGTKT